MGTVLENKLGMTDYSMEDIIKMLAALLIPNINLPKIPPILIMSGAAFRTGLSPRKIAARIIARQSEAGAYSGILPDGSDNVMEQMELIRIQEIINSLQTEAKLTTIIPPGIPVSIVGAGIGATTDYAQGNTIIQ